MAQGWTRCSAKLPAIDRGRRVRNAKSRERACANAAVLLAKGLNIMFFSVLPFAWFISLIVLSVTNANEKPWIWAPAAPVIVLILLTAWKGYGIVKAKRIYAFLHPMAAIVLAMILFDAAWMAATGQKTKWR